MELPNIDEKWLEHKQKRIKVFPQNNIRASSAGNPCDAYHYFSLKHWQEKSLHSPILQSIFDEGALHETAVIRELQEIGFEIVEQQRTFQLNKPLITGHIDGILRWNGKDFPFDVKSISPYDFDGINSAEDLIYSKKPHHWNYPAQLQLYLIMSGNEAGCFILKNKLTGQIKSIWMQIDYEYTEKILQRAERVYKAVQSETIPERSNNYDVCKQCDYRHICLPDAIANRQTQVIDDVELAGMLERRDQLEEPSKEFEAVDKKIKGIVKQSGANEYVCGNFILNIFEVIKKQKRAITWDEEEVSYLMTKIIKIHE